MRESNTHARQTHLPVTARARSPAAAGASAPRVGELKRRRTAGVEKPDPAFPPSSPALARHDEGPQPSLLALCSQVDGLDRVALQPDASTLPVPGERWVTQSGMSNGKVSKQASPEEDSLPPASRGSSWVSYSTLSSGGNG